MKFAVLTHTLILVSAFWMAGRAHSASPSRTSQERNTKPNILFILTDDLGINDLGCYGRKDHKTPRLDRLASEGIRFQSAYCAQPICSASRAALMSGRSPARLNLTTFLPGRRDTDSQLLKQPSIESKLPLQEKTLAEYLVENGYRTGYFGKWHLGGLEASPLNQGFQEYFEGRAQTQPSVSEGGKGEFELTHRAIQFIERNKASPMYLVVSHNSPHIPYTARSHLVERHSAAFEPAYAAMIETLDEAVGRLLDVIDSTGLRNNTLVVFTSDNGGLHVPELNHLRITHNSPFRAGKGFLYEGGLRIPLLVRWPDRIAAGRVESAPMMNTDWLPTLLATIRLKPDSETPLDGTDQSRLLFGRARAKNEHLFWHFPHYTNQGGKPAGAVRYGYWKLIEDYETGQFELYDLKSDPGESIDLSSREPKRIQQLSKKLSEWRVSTGARTNIVNSNFNASKHKTLYSDTKVSEFRPEKADVRQWNQVLMWRKAMDATVAGRGF